MAEIEYNVQTTGKGDLLLTWADVTENDTFQAFQLEEVVSEISVQIGGTFGGATVKITGSNDGSSFLDLLQLDGAATDATEADLYSLLERPLWVQPSASGGASQSIKVTVLVRR
jgi:hypothetical protein